MAEKSFRMARRSSLLALLIGVIGLVAYFGGFTGGADILLWAMGVCVLLLAFALLLSPVADDDIPGIGPTPPPPPRPVELRHVSILAGLAAVTAGVLGLTETMVILAMVSVGANALRFASALRGGPPAAA
jgi:hypothetical protein